MTMNDRRAALTSELASVETGIKSLERAIIDEMMKAIEHRLSEFMKEHQEDGLYDNDDERSDR